MTRAQLEQLLVNAHKGWMGVASMSITYGGSNVDLNDPIARALLDADYTVANIMSVTSAEVVAVAVGDVMKVVEFARIHLLETILGNLTGVDTTVGPRSERLSQLADRVQALLDKLLAHASLVWGYGVQPLTCGVYDLATAEVEA